MVKQTTFITTKLFQNAFNALKFFCKQKLSVDKQLNTDKRTHTENKLYGKLISYLTHQHIQLFRILHTNCILSFFQLFTLYFNIIFLFFTVYIQSSLSYFSIIYKFDELSSLRLLYQYLRLSIYLGKCATNRLKSRRVTREGKNDIHLSNATELDNCHNNMWSLPSVYLIPGTICAPYQLLFLKYLRFTRIFDLSIYLLYEHHKPFVI